MKKLLFAALVLLATAGLLFAGGQAIHPRRGLLLRPGEPDGRKQSLVQPDLDRFCRKLNQQRTTTQSNRAEE